jgi:hypothetical protein
LAMKLAKPCRQGRQLLGAVVYPPDALHFFFSCSSSCLARLIWLSAYYLSLLASRPFLL